MVSVLLVSGLALLVIGGDLLVRGASRLALVAGIPPIVIGLTVVAWGTSSPELATSVVASIAGQTDITVGNVVGSNIFNILFILGLSALITPLQVTRRLVKTDVPIMIAAAAVALLIALDGEVGGIDSAVLLAGMILYTVVEIRRSRRVQGHTSTQSSIDISPKPNRLGSLMINILMIVIGLVLLVFGSRWFVEAAVSVAASLGLSEFVIGATIVAAGTSMPEVATSVIAALKGERDIAVGNVVGSNIFNILGVLGLSGLVATGPMEVLTAVRVFDIPVLIAVSITCLPFFFSGYRIDRWEGFVFLGFYVAYLLLLLDIQSGAPSAMTPLRGMLWITIPALVLTIVVMLLQRRRPFS